jgi:hypothetical protein
MHFQKKQRHSLVCFDLEYVGAKTQSPPLVDDHDLGHFCQPNLANTRDMTVLYVLVFLTYPFFPTHLSFFDLFRRWRSSHLELNHK